MERTMIPDDMMCGPLSISAPHGSLLMGIAMGTPGEEMVASARRTRKRTSDTQQKNQRGLYHKRAYVGRAFTVEYVLSQGRCDG